MNKDGHTSSIRDKILTINVKKGWKPGTRITFPEEGDQGPNNIPADIVFILKDKQNMRFRREGTNLIYTAEISLGSALTGTVIEVLTLDDRLLSIPINDIVDPSYRKEVPGEGMPISGQPDKRGDLIIEFDINFPSKLVPFQKELIRRALTAH
ncbi:hypothetical protein NP493_1496g00014 [Ridgeia piscesae]|uniref:Chaperone DnaJ C-terminal domain-containing protein n=1 Tax=Ridgeia piscesae TaxID=27915 RepID=A0AAD9K1A3_RIDPI|nr:hypothetical protein NP493_1496g00014 [Ridgeia piscesae]